MQQTNFPTQMIEHSTMLPNKMLMTDKDLLHINIRLGHQMFVNNTYYCRPLGSKVEKINIVWFIIL